MLLVSRPVRTQDDNVKAGVAWMLLTTLFFLSLDAVAKHLVSNRCARKRSGTNRLATISGASDLQSQAGWNQQCDLRWSYFVGQFGSEVKVYSGC